VSKEEISIREFIDFWMLTTSYFAILLITDGIILITHRTTIIKYSKNHIYSGLIVAILSLLGYRQNMRLSEL